jgi:hypothetical protein
MKKIGLIAGNRKFPLLFCQGAKLKGYYVFALAIKGETSRSISRIADKVVWLKLSEFNKIFDYFKSEGISQVVMAGQVSPRRLFSREVLNSPDIQQILSSIKNKKADTIFGAVAEKLKDAGIELLDSTTFVKEFMPGKGKITEFEPDSSTWEDIRFGIELAHAIGALDIGQTVAVKDKAIVAVEAFEGTDNLIKRAGRFIKSGLTIVKVAKPKQDMRFDIPVVGLKTIKVLIRAGAKCLAIEADKTLFIDRDLSVKLAEKHGLSIIAF